MKPLLCLTLLAFGASLPAIAQDAEGPRTVIDSDSLEMQGTGERNFFYFRGNVHVSGQNLEIHCENLVITASRGGDEDATVGEIGAIERIVASGDVEIQQAGRRAVAGRAEVDPVEGTITLSENPRIIDGEVEVEGYAFVFYKDDKRIETIADPDATPDQPSRSRVSLGALPEIDFAQPEEEITVLGRVAAPGAGEEPDDPDTGSEAEPDEDPQRDDGQPEEPQP